MTATRTLPPRTLVVWCHDWPVVAAGIPPGEPAATVVANRVTATNARARADGVVVGLRRREAQGRCPALTVVEPDPGAEARAFEPVVAALETFTPRIEITHPGRCAATTRGPSRYFGGDEALAAAVTDAVASVMGDRGRCRIGIADGPFAATLAARTPLDDDHPDGRGAASPVIVPPGATPAFLAPLPVSVLEPPELVDVLVRLGLTSLGDLAALPAAAMTGRFGAEGERAHRVAQGRDARPPATRVPPPDYEVSAELDPPAEQVHTAAFTAKVLADELHHRLDSDGLACTRILVVAETEHGERFERLWRHEGALSAGAIADRVRWQLDGWLHSGAANRPTAGISRLALVPDEVLPARGRQLGFWGGASEAGARAARALARVEGLLGPGAAGVPERRGGREPRDRVAVVPASAVDLTVARPAARADWVAEPWPGRLPSPSPALVHPAPVPAEVVDGAGRPVGVSGRGTPTAAPARVTVDGRTWGEVTGWAGPWPVEERWWDAAGARRRARLQVVTATGHAGLFVLESGHWWLEATYD